MLAAGRADNARAVLYEEEIEMIHGEIVRGAVCENRGNIIRRT